MTPFVRLEKKQIRQTQLRRDIKKYTNWSYFSIFL